jgi:hypothetical protein
MRQCDGCTLCCTTAEVQGKDFYKPVGEKCIHQCNGCKIFGQESRPEVCNTFKCAWLRGFGNEEDRPDKTKVLTSINNLFGNNWIIIIEQEKDAYKTSGKNIIVDLINKVNLPAIVATNGGTTWGEYVIIKDNLEDRTEGIKDEFLFDYTENMKVYRLNYGNSNV